MAVSWKSFFQSAAGITITVLVLLLCIAYFAVELATRSNPSAYEETIASTSDTVHIYRNSFGIPHIVCKADTDLVYAQGFVHAQDRLWQMDLWRRMATGTLAEIFGEQLASTDAFLRSLDLRRYVQLQYASLPIQTKKFLLAYARGVSDFIANNRSRLPFEADALNYQPELWQAEDCLLVAKMMSLHQSPALWNDLVFSQIAHQRGVEQMLNYIPVSPGAPYSMDTGMRQPSVYYPILGPDSLLHGTDALLGALSGLKDAKQTIGLPSSLHTSNCWAVGRGTDKAILANDPHQPVGMPTRWYQIHLTSAMLNVVGLSIPGIPFVFTGRNDSLAWGSTSAMVDDVDYMIERVDQHNSNYYLDGSGIRKKFTFRRDTLHIKGKPDSLIDLRFTTRGCVISDAHPLRHQTELIKTGRPSPLSNYLSKTCMVMRWTGQVPSDEIGALYRINLATSLNALQSASTMWGVPSLVVNVACNNGSVAALAMGYVPNRKNVDVLLPHSASDSQRGWDGVLRLSDLPMIVGRSPGFVASANARLVPAGAASQSILWESNSRISRIRNQLRVYKAMNARDAQVLQQDVVSEYALTFTKNILPVLKQANKRYNRTELAALRALEQWNGSMTTISYAASIHAYLLQRMMWNTFEDELGTPLYNLWTNVGSIPTRRIAEMLDEPLNPLFDDVRTKQHENLSWIAVRSFMETVRDLTATYGTNNVETWSWGRLHQITFTHPMGHHKLLKPVLNSGPYEVGGSGTTVFNTEWSITDPFQVQITSSARVISDLSDSVQYTVLPGGISGQPMDGHYSDQMQLWLKGGYVRVPVSRQPDITFRLYHRLVPASVSLPN